MSESAIDRILNRQMGVFAPFIKNGVMAFAIGYLGSRLVLNIDPFVGAVCICVTQVSSLAMLIFQKTLENDYSPASLLFIRYVSPIFWGWFVAKQIVSEFSIFNALNLALVSVLVYAIGYGVFKFLEEHE